MARWDIFCSVVDNYGDIGVTWRLARQLAAEQGHVVRLWVDELGAFVRLCPEASVDAECQRWSGVEVHQWREPFPAVEPAQVVIEAFACQLPSAYIEAMAASGTRRLWLNLEYLSAEDWVAGCHGLPSPQPGGLQKFFFFPGFVEGTGGLLREVDLLVRRRAFQADAQAQQAFLQSLGVIREAGARLISLFAYENAGLAGWLDALAADSQSTQLLVPQGKVLANLQAWLGEAQLVPGDQRRRGNLLIHVLPFVAQDDYDRLLWCCDLNAVRGEDSFVRAQWAGRPLLWHIYPQEEGAHWDKLEAFLAIYNADLMPEAAAVQAEFWRAWNAGEGVGTAWPALFEVWPVLQRHAEQWCDEQAVRSDLATMLEQFYLNWLSYAA
ncbi:elongation factor P maturation arginine rhamnosyltransferase EarP [Pseudomonas sp. MDMC216]|nr:MULTISPECIES: elongation factor P maturation arginine rhamnosyltransferase EarP [unclassified Pseudomonas]MBA4683059.1 elongation factor P maturation arginine rhamnosyltransferase EarP [Pseudomonas sp.]MDI5995270.1 elongation factor P maturation arginine rhamnosyltransferase EarP [Pseudomonas sp. MDMC216]MDI6009563.1 elongation factor P maturation arginine rhamnosyltransferase EarP [Pseudomonas sp. MDMC17]RAR36728.1 elongation factor P maturation arginine rhamnosyltransferase EarP [Pseudomon